MKAFVIHSRPIPGCVCKPGESVPMTIVEIEGEYISPIEDPSVMWLPQGEFRFRIAKPEFLHEPHEIKKESGAKEKIMVPSVYHCHSIYFTLEAAQESAKKLVVSELEFQLRKYKIEYTQEVLDKKLSEIQIKRLA